MEGFLNHSLNNFMLYFLYVWLGGITVAIVKGEFKIELLTYKEEEKPRGRRKAKRDLRT